MTKTLGKNLVYGLLKMSKHDGSVHFLGQCSSTAEEYQVANMTLSVVIYQPSSLATLYLFKGPKCHIDMV